MDMYSYFITEKVDYVASLYHLCCPCVSRTEIPLLLEEKIKKIILDK